MTRPSRSKAAGEARLGDSVRPQEFALDGTPLISYLWMLSDLPDGDAVGFAISRGLLGPFGADLVLVYAAEPDGHTLDLVASYGMGPKVTAVYSTVTADMHLPGAEAFRMGTEKWMLMQQVADDYPLAAPFFRSRSKEGEFAFLPLRHRGAPIGFIILGFPKTVERSWQLRAAIDGLLSATVLWMLAHSALRGTTRSHLTEVPPLELTARQREILILVREGQTNAQIAQELGYSAATIKADLTSLGAMLGAHGRAELLDKAKRAGL